DIFRRTPLPEIAVNGAAEGRRRGADAKRERAEQLLAGNIVPRDSHIIRLAVPVLGKKLLEHKAIELAELVAEGGLVSNDAANGLIIRIKTEAAGFLRHQRARGDLVDGHLGKTELARLFLGQLRAEPHRQEIEIALIVALKLAEGNLCLADLDDVASDGTCQHVAANTPDGEARHQKRQHTFCEPAAGSFSHRLKHNSVYQ